MARGSKQTSCRFEGASTWLLHNKPDYRSQPLVIDPALTWATYLLPTSSLNAEPSAVALDAAGNVYLAGTALTTTGYNACFVAKLNSSGTTAAYVTLIGGSGGDNIASAIALDSVGNIYMAGATDSASFPTTDPPYPYQQPYLSPYTSPGQSVDAFVMKFDNLATSLAFSHYFGGSGYDVFNGVALDADDNVYLVGTTTSPDLPVGPALTTLRGQSNAFVVEFTSAGGPVYSTYLGGSGTDSGNAIAVDALGDAYVTGSTTSANFPVAGGPFQSTLKGGMDAFVAKIGPPGGAVIYSTYLGGSGNDEGLGIAVDKSGAVFITGDTASANFPVLGAYQSTYGGGTSNAFVTRLAGSGQTLLYSTYLGGSGTDVGYSVAIDPTGNAYVTGSTTSTNFPVTSDAFQSSNQGTTNAFVTGLNPSGSGLLFSSYLGGSGTATLPTGSTNYGDYGTALAVNCAAGLVVAGVTTSTNFPGASGTITTAGTSTSSYPGEAPDAFVAQIAAGGGVPDITPGGIVNNANFASGPVAPGSIVSIFGTFLAPFAQVFTGFPLTNSLSGVTVTVNTVPAPMFYAGSSQINIQVPFEIGAGPAAMTVSDSCGSSGQVSFQVAQAAPYILQTAAGQAILLNQDNTVNGLNNPAKVGSIAQIFLIGIGPVSNPPADGAAASTTKLSLSTLPWSATIGGWATPPSPYQFLGLAPGWVGLDQANITVPVGLVTGAYPVVITVGGVQSNGPTMYVTQ